MTKHLNNLASLTAAAAVKRLHGKEVTVVNNTTGHPFAIGSKVLCSAPSVYNATAKHIRLTSGGAYVSLSDIGLGCFTREQLEECKVDLQEELQEIEAKLAYLKKTKQEEFNDDEYKVYTTLQVLKTKKNDLEKAKVIAKLVNS